jgi:hypothetical protein
MEIPSELRDSFIQLFTCHVTSAKGLLLPLIDARLSVTDQVSARKHKSQICYQHDMPFDRYEACCHLLFSGDIVKKTNQTSRIMPFELQPVVWDFGQCTDCSLMSLIDINGTTLL